MLSLSKIITEIFLKHGLPIFCINASGCFTFKDGVVQAESIFLDPVTLSLKAGLLPAIGGDVVLDSEGGARILSGDRIARLLALKFHSKILLFGTDVDGILAPGGCIKSLNLGEIPPILKKLGGRRGDVTGGMEGKVREISAYLSDGGSLSIIFNITKHGRLTKILEGEPIEGTYIRSDQNGRQGP
jgi:isopentenyl phosphate kinase